MDTDDLPQVKTEDDSKPPKAKATEELTQADDENSSNAPPQQTGRKRKRKRGGGEKGKKKKSKNAKPVTLRRNIRYSHFVCLWIVCNLSLPLHSLLISSEKIYTSKFCLQYVQ